MALFPYPDLSLTSNEAVNRKNCSSIDGNNGPSKRKREKRQKKKKGPVKRNILIVDGPLLDHGSHFHIYHLPLNLFGCFDSFCLGPDLTPISPYFPRFG